MRAIYFALVLFSVFYDALAKLTSSQRQSILEKHNLITDSTMIPEGLSRDESALLLAKKTLGSSEESASNMVVNLKSESPVGLNLHDGGTSPIEVVLLTVGGFAVAVVGGLIYTRFY